MRASALLRAEGAFWCLVARSVAPRRPGSPAGPSGRAEHRVCGCRRTNGRAYVPLCLKSSVESPRLWATGSFGAIRGGWCGVVCWPKADGAGLHRARENARMTDCFPASGNMNGTAGRARGLIERRRLVRLPQTKHKAKVKASNRSRSR